MQPTIWEWPREWRGTIDSQFYLSPTSLSSRSPYTGQTTPFGPQVQKFVAKLTFPGLLPPHHRRVQAFITRQRGITGMLRMVDYHRMKPAYDQFKVSPTEQSWSDGTMFTDGHGWVDGYLPPFISADQAAEEGATSLVVRGLPPSIADILGMGDLFEVRPGGVPANHGHLYEIVHDSRSNTTGKTRLYFEAGLRKKVAAGDMIVLRYPTSVFRLASDQEGAVSRGLASIGQAGLSLEEVLPWQ